MKRRRKGRSKGRNIVVEPIKGYRSNLYIHSYYQIDPTSINKTSVSDSAENIKSSKSLEHATAMTLYFTSTFHSAMDIIYPKTQSKPSEGLITAFIMIPTTWIFISSQSNIACIYIIRNKRKRKRKRRHKISAEAAAHQKSKNKLKRALLQLCRKHLVLKKALAQQAKTPASEVYPQADKTIYYVSIDGKIHTTASSKSENVDCYPT